MRFQFKGDYTFEDLVCLNRVARKRFQPLNRWVLLPLILVAGTLCTIGGIALLLDGSLPLNTYLFPLILGPLFLLLALFSDRFNALTTRRLMVNRNQEREVILEEDSFTEHASSGTTTCPYGAVYAVILCRERYFLFMNKRQAHVLSRQALVQGEWEQLGDFLKEKCGKPVITVK